MQDLDFKWFLENLSALYKKYGDVYIAIKNQTVLGTYPSYADGVKTTAQTEPLGTFIVQKCRANEAVLMTYISSMNFTN